jgi:hypothetical protein
MSAAGIRGKLLKQLAVRGGSSPPLKQSVNESALEIRSLVISCCKRVVITWRRQLSERGRW